MAVIIIGSGIAAVSAIKSFRSRDRKTKITLITDEALPFYYRPMLPLLLSGERHVRDVVMDFNHNAYDVDLIYGTVHEVNPASNTVKLNDGERLSYERLLIASGGKPVIPEIAGIKDGPGVFTFRNIHDAGEIQKYSETSKAAVVIGAGLVGVKTALALRRKGMKITVVERMPTILIPRADTVASEIIASRLSEAGIDILLNQRVKGIVRSNDGRVSGVMTDGAVIQADMVVLAVGVTPNTGFLKRGDILLDRGILVNDKLQSSVSNIYAAGDVAQLFDPVIGESIPSTLWTNAVEMGKVAGANIAGSNERYSAFLSIMNAADIGGVPFVSAGITYDSLPGCDVFVEKNGGNYRKLVFQDGRLIGVLLTGDASTAGVLVGALKNRLFLNADQKNGLISGKRVILPVY